MSLFDLEESVTGMGALGAFKCKSAQADPSLPLEVNANPSRYIVCTNTIMLAPALRKNYKGWTLESWVKRKKGGPWIKNPHFPAMVVGVSNPHSRGGGQFTVGVSAEGCPQDDATRQQMLQDAALNPSRNTSIKKYTYGMTTYAWLPYPIGNAFYPGCHWVEVLPGTEWIDIRGRPEAEARNYPESVKHVVYTLPTPQTYIV